MTKISRHDVRRLIEGQSNVENAADANLKVEHGLNPFAVEPVRAFVLYCRNELEQATNSLRQAINDVLREDLESVISHSQLASAIDNVRQAYEALRVDGQYAVSENRFDSSQESQDQRALLVEIYRELFKIAPTRLAAQSGREIIQIVTALLANLKPHSELTRFADPARLKQRLEELRAAVNEDAREDLESIEAMAQLKKARHDFDRINHAFGSAIDAAGQLADDRDFDGRFLKALDPKHRNRFYRQSRHNDTVEVDAQVIAETGIQLPADSQ